MQLSKLENLALESVKELQIFRAKDLSLLLGFKITKIYNIIKSLKRKEAINQIANGVFALKNVDEFTIGCRLNWPSYISFWSALNYYGFSDQNPKIIFLASTRYKKQVKQFKFVTIDKERFFGYTRLGNSTIADKEKTIIDCLLFPKYCGGIKEVENAIKYGLKKIIIRKLVKYTIKVKSKAVVRRLGFLLEKNNLGKSFLKHLEKAKGRGFELLDPTRPKKKNFDKNWLLDVNWSKKLISKEELIWIKNQRKTSLYYEEKEYFQYIFLKSISNYGERFVFKGGTCLRICYESERASEDLDFNTNLNIEATKKIVKKALDEFKLLNIENVLLEEKEFQGNIRFEIRFKGPLYEGSSKSTNTVKIDFNQNPTEFTKVKIIPKLFSDIVPFPLVVMDLKEIFSEKIRALASRSQARDLYDIWMLIQNKVEVNEKLIEKKLKEENVSLQNIIFPSKKEYENDLKNLLTFLPPYDQVTKEVQKEIEKIKIK